MSQSASLYDTRTPWSARIGPVVLSVTNGSINTDVSTAGATLSGLMTVSHNVHIVSVTPETGVAYGAPGMPIGCPLGIRLSSSDFTANGVPALPSTSRADVRLYTGRSCPLSGNTTYS